MFFYVLENSKILILIWDLFLVREWEDGYLYFFLVFFLREGCDDSY